MGVFHTTFSSLVVKITKFQGNYIDFRKRDMIPSAVAGNKKPWNRQWSRDSY